MKTLLIGLLLLILLPMASLSQQGVLAPTIYTSTRQVTGIVAAPDGSVWVATTGGVCRFTPDGRQTKFTRLDGLPSHEARRIAVRDGSVIVTFPTAAAVWKAERWQIEPIPPSPANAGSTPLSSHSPASNAQHPTSNTEPLNTDPQRPICEALWRGKHYLATARGLYTEGEAGRQDVPLPPSTGTHVSAMLARRDGLMAALFGEGLWQFDGKAWKPFAVPLPPETQDITALAEQGTTLWMGTRRAGAWRLQAGKWQSMLMRDEPFSHNCQALATYAGELFCSSLEDGLAIRGVEGWRHETTPMLSLHAPRQMAVFQGKLYLRQTNGRVDRFDGAGWERNVFAGIPRQEVTALTADAAHLYIAQWGGWSVWNGKAWTHHLDNPTLQSIALTGLQPDGDTLWIGTQGKGVLEANITSQEIRRYDERHGLPDDWITCLLRVGKSLYAGTFVGGPAHWDGAKWNTFSQLQKANVTALACDAQGGVWIGTRTGLWHLGANGVPVRVNDRLPWLDEEIQSLCADGSGLWVGTRASLNFLPQSVSAPQGATGLE